MKALLTIVVLALVILSACGTPAQVDPVQKTNAKDTMDQTETAPVTEPVEVVGADVAEIEESLADLSLDDLSSIDADLLDLETLDY